MPIPIAAAREATPTVRRVRFSPAATPSGTPQQEEEEEEDDIAGGAHLPQTFHHALPTSSLEPGTTNPHFPPDQTFPDPLCVGGDPVQGQTPLQVAAGSINDNQQLLAELKATIWDQGLHVSELFGGIGVGVLRSALAIGHQIRCYTYVDKDDVSRRVAAVVLRPAAGRSHPGI